MIRGEIARWARLLAGGLLDVVYPPHCLVCERARRPCLCAECAGRFVPVPAPSCCVCGRPEEHDGRCRHCATWAPGGKWGFSTARAAGVYEGPLRRALHRFKYERKAELGEALGAYLANRCVVDHLLRGSVDAVIPVPIHPARERARGFNQAALLARPVADLLGVPLLSGALRRVRKTAPQVGLSGEARRRNLAGAFLVPEPGAVYGRRVVLVDDVFTTGSTVSECAAALTAVGALPVPVVTLAAGG